MRQFARPSSLTRLSLEARIVYTVFLFFMLLGAYSSFWLYQDDDLGTKGQDAVRYYLGDKAVETKSPKPKPAASKGPELDLPTEDGPSLELPGETVAPTPNQAGMRFEKPPRQVIETFHFHLFSMPVCLLIIAHIFMMGAHSTRIKAWIIGIASVATLVHMVVPPLIRFVSPSFGGLMFPSALLLGATWCYMSVQPMVEMWRPSGLPSAKAR